MTTQDVSRRTLLKTGALLGGISARPVPLLGQAPSPAQRPSDWRTRFEGAPIEVVNLTNQLALLTGPGGNVVVWHGEEGKVVVDTFVRGAFPALKERLDAMGAGIAGERHTAILFVVNTNWLFDHTGNNESFRELGAQIVAHENTPRRLAEPHDVLGMHLDPAPAAAMPTETFAQFHRIKFELPGREEFIDLGHVRRAHTDTDIYAHFVMGDVLHLGDTFFNGIYPFLDPGTGGTIDGLVAAIEEAGKGLNPGTKIVPGHGPLADREALAKYRDMLVTVRDRVRKLKMAGQSEPEVIAAQPTADLDAAWGQGFIHPVDFVSAVYKTV